MKSLLASHDFVSELQGQDTSFGNRVKPTLAPLMSRLIKLNFQISAAL